jgi:RimJ/RimL family protein N-acetyltransferase
MFIKTGDSLATLISLETGRLTLKPHEPHDLEASYSLWSDPKTTTFIGGRPFTREECWSRILRYRGLWSTLGYGYWAVFEKSTGRFIGEVGLADFQRDFVPMLDAPEAGWAVMPWAQGQGYATEAMRAALAWAQSALPFHRVVCIINPENIISTRVAYKLGFQQCGGSIYKDDPIDIFQYVFQTA